MPGPAEHRGARVMLALLTVTLLATPFAGAARAARPDTKTMVLRLSDLHAEAKVSDTYYASNSRAAMESPGLTLADFTRWGRVMGYAAEYALAHGTTVISRAEIFKTSSGANDSLRSSFADATRVKTASGDVLHFKRVAGMTVGEEGRLYTSKADQGGSTVMLAAVYWRDGTAKGELFLIGPPATVNVASVTRLADEQQSRIAAALR